jgi:hypothetical protein
LTWEFDPDKLAASRQGVHVDLIDTGQERAELDAILNSAAFRKAPNQSRFLRYLCERHFEGLSEQPKEHQIAIEALGRSEDFDEREDSIVRVEAFRLRRRLERYYQTEGSAHPLRIAIDAGQYRVRFMEARENGGGNISGLVLENEVLPDAPLQKKDASGRRRWIAAMFLAVVSICLAVTAVVWQRHSKLLSQSPSTAAVPSVASPPAVLNSGPGVRILAGYSRPAHLDRLGQVWGADNWFHGGEAIVCPRQLLARTPDRSIYRHCRRGNFSYDIPLNPGVYELRLYFGPSVAPWTLLEESVPQYPIMLRINKNSEKKLFINFSADGALNSIPDIRVFRDVTPASDGFLHLTFANGGSQYAFVNAIEILPSMRGRLVPIRMTASDSFYADTHGNIWPPERYYRGGTSVERRDEVSGTADPDLFGTERYGPSFDYLIPVADTGIYAVTLGFAETWFGPRVPGGGGAQSRLFDISCNGTSLVKNLDVYKEAGGSDRALIKTFHNLHPDADGKLRLTFTASRNNAMINFLEIDDETGQKL